MRNTPILVVGVLFSVFSFVAPQCHAQQLVPNVPANMARAKQSLEAAKSQLVNAGDNWGGHRAAAISLVDQALQEIQKAEVFASRSSLPAGTTTIPSTPSAGLVSQLTKGLSITPTQASGGAGALFSLAKSRLTAEEFTKVAGAVPGMDGLLKAAPATRELPGLSTFGSSLPGGLGGMASAAGSFQKLGLSPDMISKFVPVLLSYVQSRGGASTSALLSKVWQ